MNILQLVPKLEIGGVERGTVDLSRYLTLNAHKAVVISQGGRLIPRLDEVGARHYELPIGSKNPFVIVYMIFKTCDIIKRENIHIVHARSRVPALIGYFASKLTLRIFVTTAHGQYRKHLLSYVMGWGKLVIVANSAMRQYMHDVFGVKTDKMRIIPRGVDVNKFKHLPFSDKKSGKFVVAMISRLTPIKGHIDFIKAVSLLHRKVNKLKAYIIGNVSTAKKDYVNDLKLLIKRHALEDILELKDQIDDVPKALSEVDVLVSASMQQEAFGRILIEAMSCGVPCVATNVGGAGEIIEDKKTGLLVESSNPNDISDKVFALFSDKKLAEKISKNARKKVEDSYSLQHMMESTIKVYEEVRKMKKILVIKISALGDVILAIPSLMAIRKKFPKAVIKVLTGIASRDILKNVSCIDGIIVCDFKKRDAGFKGLLKIGSILKREDFDTVIDFQNNRKSHMLSFLSFSSLRYGYDNGKFSSLLNRKIKDDKMPIDPIEHQKQVLKMLGIFDVDKNIEMSVTKEDIEWADDFLKSNWINFNKPIVCINLESSLKWASKRWPAEYFAQVSDALANKYHIRPIITGLYPDTRQAKDFFKFVQTKPVSAMGKTTIGRLAALIKKSSLLITSDSAPMHLASACKTPFIALFGPTDPKRHVFAKVKHKIIMKDLPCSMCYKTRCLNNYQCMLDIKPEEVISEISPILKLKKR